MALSEPEVVDVQRSLGRIEGALGGIKETISELRTNVQEERMWRSEIIQVIQELRDTQTQTVNEIALVKQGKSERSRFKTLVFSASLTGALQGVKAWLGHSKG